MKVSTTTRSAIPAACAAKSARNRRSGRNLWSRATSTRSCRGNAPAAESASTTARRRARWCNTPRDARRLSRNAT
jgi:hypothetical protein